MISKLMCMCRRPEPAVAKVWNSKVAAVVHYAPSWASFFIASLYLSPDTCKTNTKATPDPTMIHLEVTVSMLV